MSIITLNEAERKQINKDIVSGSLLQRLTLGRNNIPDGRVVLIGLLVLKFDRLPL